MEGIVTLVLAFSATLDAIPRPLFRAHYHSLSRLKDAYTHTGSDSGQEHFSPGRNPVPDIALSRAAVFLLFMLLTAKVVQCNINYTCL